MCLLPSPGREGMTELPRLGRLPWLSLCSHGEGARRGGSMDALAISTSLLAIVFTSVIIGALLPLLLQRCHCDPAHAGATIQVIMDLAGVCITCTVCSLLLPE